MRVGKKISTRIEIYFFADDLSPNDDVHFMSHARGTTTQKLKKCKIVAVKHCLKVLAGYWLEWMKISWLFRLSFIAPARSSSVIHLIVECCAFLIILIMLITYASIMMTREQIILMTLFFTFSDNLALCVYACAQMKFACQLLLCSSTCSISWFTLEMDFLIREPFSSSLTFAYCPLWAKLGSKSDMFYVCFHLLICLFSQKHILCFPYIFLTLKSGKN